MGYTRYEAIIPGALFIRGIYSLLAIHGVLRWLRRVWTICQDHIAACQEGGGEKGGRDREEERDVREDEYKKIITTTTHQTIKEVRNAACRNAIE